MQFEFISNHSVNTMKFTEIKGLKLKFFDAIVPIFQRMGAKFPEGTLGNIEFPKFTNVALIKEILRNTCYECGGLMQDGIALVNTSVSFDDFGGDAGTRGSTQSRVGKAVEVTVRKCTVCGHSHT